MRREDFWTHVRRGENCWEWTACRAAVGYGQLRLDGKTTYAHRTAYELERGPIPPGMFVCHTCDNRLCVNPNHLFLGVARDNVRDMMAKGRSKTAGVFGKAHPRGKLTGFQWEQIRFLVALGYTHRELAAAYGVSNSLISMSLAGKLGVR